MSAAFFDEGVCFTARGNEQIDSDFTVQRMVDDDVMHFAAVVDDYFKFFFDAVLIVSMTAADSFQQIGVLRLDRQNVAARCSVYIVAGGAQNGDVADDYLTADLKFMRQHGAGERYFAVQKRFEDFLAPFFRIHTITHFIIYFVKAATVAFVAFIKSCGLIMICPPRIPALTAIFSQFKAVSSM